jgi:hypothetical protein
MTKGIPPTGKSVHIPIDPLDAAIISNSDDSESSSEVDSKISVLNPKEIITSSDDPSSLAGSGGPAKPLKGRVSWLRSAWNAVANFFYRIFCCFKRQEKSIGNSFSQTIEDESTIKSCKEILLARGNNGLSDYKLIPFKAEGTVLMPQQFVLDLPRQVEDLKINGKSYVTKETTVDKCEILVAEMKKALGDNGAIAAARLLNQSGIGVAFEKLQLKSNALLDKENEKREAQGEPLLDTIFMRTASGFHFEIKTKGKDVILKIRQSYQGYDVSSEQYNGRFTGIMVRYKVPKAELDRLGALSPKELQAIDMESFKVKSSVTFTKTYGTLEDVMAALNRA